MPQPYDDPTSGPSGDGHDQAVVAATPVVVRRNAGLAALVGGGASAIAIAYLWRATQAGSLVDGALCLVMALIAGFYLTGLIDARTPLLVADDLGVRIRLGNQWRGLPWEAVRQVVVAPRRGLLRDGRLVFSPHSLGRALDGLDTRGRRSAALNQKMYGAALAVPVGLTTRVSRIEGDGTLADQLAALARGRADVVVVEPEPAADPDTTPTAAGGTDHAGGAANGTATDETPAAVLETPVPETPVPAAAEAPEADAEAVDRDEQPEPAPRPRRSFVGEIGTIVSRVAKGRSHDVDRTSAPEPEDDARDHRPAEVEAPAARVTAVPLRSLRRALRAEVTRDVPATTLGPAALHDAGDRRTSLPEGRELRRPGSVDLFVEAVPDSRVRPISQFGAAVEPLVIDDFVTEPAYDPVIGPELAAARTRLGLSVDELAERTRIRPHVIESIEVDDFAPCGGDFYARGHLRTLARVLGQDVTPLLEQFDNRYATAPINARRVFEAELATGMTGSMRSTVGGPNWALMVGAVLLLVMVWGVVRFFATEPPELLQAPAPALNGSAGVDRAFPEAGSLGSAGKPVTVTLTTGQGRSQVVVRDADKKVVFAGTLAPGAHKTLHAAPPVTVRADNGGAVRVRVNGQPRGAVGEPGKPGTRVLHR